ncbi:hypothetical protein PIB30_076740 [Stylosanthes scabra]|uniref:Uncharacterized protein n=1 Tax=Stylosanthes scabra TaxID=79078 RepID=A0ABU6QQH9_9FABA|nr:hypothetical protein [Stylosanthes scabra]
MEAQGVPVAIVNLAIHRHREEEMNRERMRHNQMVQEAAAERASEANKGKTREVAPDSEEEESEEMYSSPSEEWIVLLGPLFLVGTIPTSPWYYLYDSVYLPITHHPPSKSTPPPLTSSSTSSPLASPTTTMSASPFPFPSLFLNEKRCWLFHHQSPIIMSLQSSLVVPSSKMLFENEHALPEVILEKVAQYFIELSSAAIVRSLIQDPARSQNSSNWRTPTPSKYKVNVDAANIYGGKG